MNRKPAFTLPLAVLLLAQCLSPGWGAAPPNPTASDNSGNTAGGTQALISNTSGSSNTGFGYGALASNTTGSSNTASGYGSLALNTTGSYNTASGSQSLTFNTTGSYNTASGRQSLNFNTGSYNTASGNESLRFNATGFRNTAIGNAALYSNTTGSNNTASGNGSLYSNKTGSNNTASGYGSLAFNTTGSNNTAVGLNALYSKTTGSNNLALGQSAGVRLTTGNNNIYLSNVGAAIESSTIRIGNASNHTRAFMAGVRGRKTGLANAVAVLIDSNGQLGTTKSSERFKKDIHDMDAASRRLLELRPVTYHYKELSEDGSSPLEYGLIAEEVAKVYPDLVAYGADGKVETVQYHKLTPMLVNEVQRLNALLQGEKDRNVAQTQEIADLKQQMAVLQTQAQGIKALASRLAGMEARQTLGSVDVSLVKDKNFGIFSK
jgi:Chaperone of endosialidase